MIIRRLRLIAGLITLAVLAYFGATATDYWQALAGLSMLALAGAYLAVTADRLVMAWKWNDLLAVVATPLSFFRAFQIYCSAQLWGMALPATVGADAVRVGCTVAEGRPAASVTASVIVERALGVLITLFIGLIAMLAAGFHSRPDPTYALALAIVSALFVVAVLATLLSMSQGLFELLHNKLLKRYAEHRIGRLLRKLHDAYLAFRKAPRTLMRFSCWTAVEVLLHALFLYILLTGLGAVVSFASVTAALVAASLISRIPISVAGLGVFEAGFVYVLHLEGVPIETSLLAAVLGRIILLLALLPWWAVYSFERRALRSAEPGIDNP